MRPVNTRARENDRLRRRILSILNRSTRNSPRIQTDSINHCARQKRPVTDIEPPPGAEPENAANVCRLRQRCWRERRRFDGGLPGGFPVQAPGRKGAASRPGRAGPGNNKERQKGAPRPRPGGKH